MAVIKSYTKIKGATLTPQEASVAKNLLNLGKGGWLGAEFKNWSYSSTSNEIVAELQDGGSGLTVQENKDFFPYIVYKSMIVPTESGGVFSGWVQDYDWAVDNGDNLTVLAVWEEATDFSTATNGAQYVSGEPYTIFPHRTQKKIPNTSKFILQIVTNYPNEETSITESGDFGLIDYTDIPEGGYKIYKSVTRDGDTVPKFVKIVRTTNTSVAQAYPTLLLVFYDQNSNIITKNISSFYLTLGGTT